MSSSKKVIELAGLGRDDALKALRCAASQEMRELAEAANNSIMNVECAALKVAEHLQRAKD